MQKILTVFFVFICAATTYAQAGDFNALFKKGTQLADVGQYELALHNYTEALAALPSKEMRVLTHYNIGVCHYKLGRFQESAVQYEKALELSEGKSQKVAYALGMVQYELRNFEAARNAFKKGIELSNGRDADAWFDLAIVQLAEKDSESAQESFRQAIKHGGKRFPSAHNNLGVLLAVNGDLNAAEKEFEIAVKQSKGQLPEAERNLEICRQLAKSVVKTELAQLRIVTARLGI